MINNKIPKHSQEQERSRCDKIPKGSAYNNDENIPFSRCPDIHNKIPPEIKDEELKEPKLLWKGTTAEAIKLGKVTQEDVDRWNRNDEEGESYSEGYDEGFKAGQTQTKNEVLKFAKDFFDELYGRTNMGMFKKELSEEFERRLKAGVQDSLKDTIKSRRKNK